MGVFDNYTLLEYILCRGELMNVKEIRQRLGMTQLQFAEYFEISLRTIQKWERGGSTPPEYIPKMMGRIARLEGKYK